MPPDQNTEADPQLNALAKELECRFLQGDRGALGELLARHPDVAAAPRRAAWLVYQEILLRERLGDGPAADEYRRRFPDLAEHLGRLIEEDFGALVRPRHRRRPVALRLSGYRVLKELGHGGMAVVYKARHLRLKRLVALKMIRAGADADAHQLARFRAEAEVVARMDHTGIVQIYEVGSHAGQLYLALEFVAGGTLAQRCAGQPQPAGEAARLVKALAEAVAHAHGKGVVHRDLKPGNVLLTEDGQPKIADFGLAKLLDAAPGRGGPQTQSGAILGTPQYMAPEQAAGKRVAVGPAADVYALGAILYELLTGRPPFRAETSLETVLQVVGDEPVPPRRLVPKVPRDLETVCLKCLQKEPGQRYASAQELADDLGRSLEGRPVRARPVGPARRLARWGRRNPVVASFGGAALMLFAAVVIVSLWAALVARQAARDREYDVLLRQIQLERTPPLKAGWRDRAWELAEHTAMIRADFQLRSEAAAVLAGLDARLAGKPRERDASAVAFDRTGRWLLFGGMTGHEGQPDTEAGLWDTTTEDASPSGQGGAGPVAFGPDDTPLQLSATQGADLSLWDARQHRALARFGFGPAAKLLANPFGMPLLALAPNGTRAAAAAEVGDSGLVGVWDGATGEELLKKKVRATALALSPDGCHLAVGDEGGSVTVWSVPGAEPPAVLPLGRIPIRCVAFSPDGQRLAAGDASATISLCDWPAGQVITRYYGSTYAVYVLAFSPDGTILASGGHGDAKLWDAATGRHLLDIGLDRATGLAFSPDGHRLAGCSRTEFGRGSVALWDLEDGRGISTLRGLAGPVARVCFSADGGRVAAYGHAQQVAVWNIGTGRLLLAPLDAPPANTAENAAVAFVGNDQVACAGWEKAVLWNLPGGDQQDEWPLPRGAANSLAADAAGRRLLLLRSEHPREEATSFVARLRELLPGGQCRELGKTAEFTKEVFATAATADGRLFFATGRDDEAGGLRRTVVALRGSDGAILWSSEPCAWKPNFDNLLVDPSGRLVAAFDLPDGAAGSLQRVLLDVETGKRQVTPLPRADALGVGTRCWLASADAPYRGFALWEQVADGPAVVLTGDGDPAFWPQFSPDGARAAWGNTNGTVTLCDLPRVRECLERIGLGW